MKIWITIYSALLSLLIFAPPVGAGETITLANGEWPPYLSQKFKHNGVISRIVKEAFAEEGVSVDYVFMPWKRSNQTAANGDFAGSIVWRDTPAHRKNFHISDPVLHIESVFFHRLDHDFNWQTYDDIGKHTVGGTLGYAYENDLKAAAQKNGGKYDTAPTDLLNFQKLVAGRIDIFPCDKVVGYYLLRTNFIAGVADYVRYHPNPLFTDELHLLISKKTPNALQLIEKFNKGLAKLREKGLYAQYMDESFRGDYLPQ